MTSCHVYERKAVILRFSAKLAQLRRVLRCCLNVHSMLNSHHFIKCIVISIFIYRYVVNVLALDVYYRSKLFDLTIQV